MPTAYEDHAKMLDALRTEQDAPELVFTWNDADWLILPGGSKFGRKNDFGGLALSCDLQLTATTEQFGSSPPQAAESITFQELDYTIESVTTMPTGKQIRINANLNVAEK